MRHPLPVQHSGPKSLLPVPPRARRAGLADDDAAARRFEEECRRQLDCAVEASFVAHGRGFELRVVAAGGGRAGKLTVRGVDGESWADPSGMESLARVASVFVEPEPEAPAARPDRPGPSSRASGSGRIEARGLVARLGAGGLRQTTGGVVRSRA